MLAEDMGGRVAHGELRWDEQEVEDLKKRVADYDFEGRYGDRGEALLDGCERLINFIGLPIRVDRFGPDHDARRAYRARLPEDIRRELERNKLRVVKLNFALGRVILLGEDSLIPPEMAARAAEILARISVVSDKELVDEPDGRRMVDLERSHDRFLYDEMAIDGKIAVAQEVTVLAVDVVRYLTGTE